ncbi:purple acid phosphatase family protein [Cellulosimicrobium arenosum]|uniref:Metallophosphoesterase family protein n=1 Tax=Cellulosimicrobium arenosum TaxID=2708133 RepID=A0A927PEM7_9MICO|nr:metallophosphoesterase family protein [Cellulosimicrobium arenosum]MBD8079936.1 metallophosphoesterase family protein [Cellulosimicrobium arenosum]
MNLHASHRPGASTRTVASTVAFSLVGALLVTGVVTATSDVAAAADESLISSGDTTWRYLEDNTNPAGSDEDQRVWTTTGFDDSAWKSGTGAFGAKRGQATGIGDAFPITTLLTQYVESTTTDVPTFFFRTDVDVTAAELDAAAAFEGEIVYDDAAIVYVNGEEVARLGDEDREITQNLQYFGTSRSDPVTSTFVVPASALEAGENTISVALYQDAPTSSDIYLDVRSLVPTQGEVRDVTLGIGADETQATVAWFANLPGSGEVQWAPAQDVVGGTFPLDAQSAPSAADASVDGATYHHAAISGLEENSSYVYRVGSAATGWSEPATFDTGTFGDEYSFLFVGDIQIGASGSTSNDTASWVRNAGTIDERHPDAAFLVSAGDQVDSSGSTEQYAGLFSAASMRTLRFAPDVGNHDAGSMLYDQHYARPNATEGMRDYWYGYGDVLFVSLDSNQSSDAGIDEREAYLRGVIDERGDDYEWVVVSFHHSLYSQAFHSRDADVVRLRERLAPVFSELGVDVVLAGHDHIFTRSHLMDGTTPVVPETEPAIGDVLDPQDGQVLYVTGNSSTGSKYYDFDGAKPWTARWEQSREPSYSEVDVTPTSFTVTTYATATERVVDRVTVRHDGAAAPQLDVTASARCLAGRAYVAVRATNVGADAADVELSTPYGSRTFADVGPGTSAYQSFAVRATSVDAGTATATVTDDGASHPSEAGYASLTCP